MHSSHDQLVPFLPLVQNDFGIIDSVVIQPAHLLLLHVNAAVAAVARKRFISTCIIVGEIRPNAIIRAPPAIVEEVTARVVLHRVIDFRIGIPES
jgi:hypothetical protein